MVGLTRLEWNEAREAWRSRLGQAGESAAALARAFGEAFAQESSQVAASRPHASSPTSGEVSGSIDEAIEPSVDSTLAPIPAKVAAKPLPFREGRGGPPPTVALQMSTPRGDDEGGETIGIAGTIVPTAATPFEEAALERWTVEAYARFVADRRIDPADQARAAYGLANTAEESALLVHMNKRFGSDPELLRQWQQLVAARLKERGRS